MCLWSHAGWTPGHIHFVVQPAWGRLKGHHGRPGPFLQVDMSRAGEQSPRDEVEAFAERAREGFPASGTALTQGRYFTKHLRAKCQALGYNGLHG